MISADDFQRLCAGEFAGVALVGGPTVQGYAARDPDDPESLRIDGLATEDDGSVATFSLRLGRTQIEAAQILVDPPEVTDSSGKLHRVPRGFFN